MSAEQNGHSKDWPPGARDASVATVPGRAVGAHHDASATLPRMDTTRYGYGFTWFYADRGRGRAR